MSYTIIGSCPKCGAPIYCPTVWHGITPPPTSYSCWCHPVSISVKTTGTFYLPMPTGPSTAGTARGSGDATSTSAACPNITLT